MSIPCPTCLPLDCDLLEDTNLLLRHLFKLWFCEKSTSSSKSRVVLATKLMAKCFFSTHFAKLLSSKAWSAKSGFPSDWTSAHVAFSKKTLSFFGKFAEIMFGTQLKTSGRLTTNRTWRCLWMVKMLMDGRLKNFQVVYSIIIFYSILVVNMLIGFEKSPKVFFHYNPVLINPTMNYSVFIDLERWMIRTINSDVTRLRDLRLSPFPRIGQISHSVSVVGIVHSGLIVSTTM